MSIVSNNWPIQTQLNPRSQLSSSLNNIKVELLKLNRDKYADLRSQMQRAKVDLESLQSQLMVDPTCSELQLRESQAQAHYISLTSSVIDLIRQQFKAEWIGYGDDCTSYFFAKVKQRKTSTYVYELQDDQGQAHKGFTAVASVLHNYFSKLLGQGA